MFSHNVGYLQYQDDARRENEIALMVIDHMNLFIWFLFCQPYKELQTVVKFLREEYADDIESYDFLPSNLTGLKIVMCANIQMAVYSRYRFRRGERWLFRNQVYDTAEDDDTDIDPDYNDEDNDDDLDNQIYLPDSLLEELKSELIKTTKEKDPSFAWLKTKPYNRNEPAAENVQFL